MFLLILPISDLDGLNKRNDSLCGKPSLYVYIYIYMYIDISDPSSCNSFYHNLEL